jgi:hypothetical protein
MEVYSYTKKLKGEIKNEESTMFHPLNSTAV